MPKGHRIKPEQIVMLLRQIDLLEPLSISGSSITTTSDHIALWVTDHLRLKVKFLILLIIKQPCFNNKMYTLYLSVALK